MAGRSNRALKRKAGGTEQRRTANTARKGETSQISPAGAGTPHQQTPAAETRRQIRGLRSQERQTVPTRTPRTLTEHIAASGSGSGRRTGLGVDSHTSSCPMPTGASTGSTRPRPEQPRRRPRSRASNRRPQILRRCWFLQLPVHSFLSISPGSASRSTDQPSRPTKPTRDRRERRFLRNLTARTQQRGAESRRAHSNGEEEQGQSLQKGRGFIVSTLPGMPSTLRTYSRLCHLHARTGVHLRGSGTPVVIPNADGHFRNPNAVA